MNFWRCQRDCAAAGRNILRDIELIERRAGRITGRVRADLRRQCLARSREIDGVADQHVARCVQAHVADDCGERARRHRDCVAGIAAGRQDVGPFAAARKLAAARAYVEIERIEQQVSECSSGRTEIGGTGKDQVPLTRDFCKTAVAALRAAACAETPVELRCRVRPHDDASAIASVCGIRAKRGVGPHERGRRVLYRRVAALIVAADAYLSATRRSGRIDQSCLNDRNAIAEHTDIAACARPALRAQLTGHTRFTCSGLNEDFSTGLTAGGRGAAGGDGHVIFRLENDTPGLIANERIGTNVATVS